VNQRILALAALALLAPAATRASDESDVLRSRAVRLVRGGDCEAALPLLQRSLAADPSEARAGLLAGRCLIAQRRYTDAEAALLDTSRRNPGLAGVQLQLAVARYHREDLAGARTALEAARAESAGDAQFELYDGLVLLGENRRAEALAALDRSRAADAARVDPVASYYEGLAASGQGEQRRARAALERVSAQDPGGPWGSQAKRQMDRMGRGLQSDGWFAGSIGYEWDSDTVLEGDGVRTPEDLDPSKNDDLDRISDTRFVWRANGGIEALRTLEWSAGGMVTYTGSAHDDVDQLDYHYPIGSVWVDRHLSERTTAHLQYDMGYAWVDSESWMNSHNLGPALFHDWGNGQQTRLFGRAYAYNFRFDRRDAGEHPADVHIRNRDGNGVAVGAEHLFPVTALASDLRAGIMGTRYDARGTEYSHRAIDSWIGTFTRLPWEVNLSMRGGFTYRPYNHSTSFEDPNEPSPAPGERTTKTRRDYMKYFEVGLEKPIWNRTSAELRWRYVDNASTADVFDYDRSVVGGYLNVRFD